MHENIMSENKPVYDAGEAKTEELKPCPFCGGEGEKTNGQDIDGRIFSAATCGCLGLKRIDRDLWNNAWAHKQIQEIKTDAEGLAEVLESKEETIWRNSLRMNAIRFDLILKALTKFRAKYPKEKEGV